MGGGDPKSHAMKRHLWTVLRKCSSHHRHVFDFNQAPDGIFGGDAVCAARRPKMPAFARDGQRLSELSLQSGQIMTVVVCAAIIERDAADLLVTRRQRARTRRLLGVSRRQMRPRRNPHRLPGLRTEGKSLPSTPMWAWSCCRPLTSTPSARSSCTLPMRRDREPSPQLGQEMPLWAQRTS